MSFWLRMNNFKLVYVVYYAIKKVESILVSLKFSLFPPLILGGTFGFDQIFYHSIL